MKKLIFTGTFMMCVMFLSAGSKYPSWLEGSWSGTGFQPSDQQYWQTELSFEDGHINIDYPDIADGCLGNWEYANKKKTVYHFVETIYAGECDSPVQVYITKISADAISVAYYLPGILEGVIAYSVLERE